MRNPAEERACQKCGTTFIDTDSRRIFCSPACSHRYRHPFPERAACLTCGTAYQPVKRGQRHCSKACRHLASYRHSRGRRDARECPQCGVEFRRTNEDQVFCSRACVAERFSRPTPCEDCGALLPRHDGKPTTRCGACDDQRARIKSAQQAMRAEERARSLQRTCLWCQVSFAARNVSARCCSKVCRSRLESRARKQRLKGLAPTIISIVAVYHRDHGRCGLCHKRVPLTKKYPHPLAATVDHIVPITQGGEHTFENVQLAHARCNLLKGNRQGGQLRLFG